MGNPAGVRKKKKEKRRNKEMLRLLARVDAAEQGSPHTAQPATKPAAK